MIEKKKIAIYVDYSIRNPAFKESYEIFRSSLFKDDLDTSFEDEIQENDYRFYWQKQLKNQDICDFYSKIDIAKIDNYSLKGNFKEYFFNDEHHKRFLDDFSFNLYSSSDVVNKNDISIINIAQAHLFDITLIDVFSSIRKIGNTYHFLAKNRIYTRGVLFLSEHDKINNDNYFGIWNPIENPSQINEEDSKVFLQWMIDLETKIKKENLKERNV